MTMTKQETSDLYAIVMGITSHIEKVLSHGVAMPKLAQMKKITDQDTAQYYEDYF